MVIAKIIKGKKFMWDGNTYQDENSAKEIARGFEKDGFETEVLEEENNFYIFTRRKVEEIVIEGQPTI